VNDLPEILTQKKRPFVLAKQKPNEYITEKRVLAASATN